MTPASQTASANRNIALYPWFKLFHSLMFAQAIWFLYFQETLTPAKAIMLYAISDLATTVLEVPSGYASDRFGRRWTLLLAAMSGVLGTALIGFGDSFEVFVMGQILFGVGGAFMSGTDSAFLYESLHAAGRQDEVEAQELRAWRFTFVALALSAVTGGAVALADYSLTFLMSSACLGVCVLIAMRFVEPPHATAPPQAGEVVRFAALKQALLQPVLIWLFVLSLLMYVFSHIPFVFGQPFIDTALREVGMAANAPVLSGAVTTLMMLTSVVASLFAPRLRDRIGLVAILCLAFGMQIGLAGVLALTNAPIVIALLLLRMVPDAFSRPFIIARIQPELSDSARATYLSLQSLAGRVLFAVTLFLAAGSTDGAGVMAYKDIRVILGAYVLLGVVALMGLLIAARRLPIENRGAA